MHVVLKPSENKFIAEKMFIQINIKQRRTRGVYEDWMKSVQT